MADPGRPPFRADHVGSLLRPKELRQAFREHGSRRARRSRVRRHPGAAIRDVVALQEEVGPARS